MYRHRSLGAALRTNPPVVLIPILEGQHQPLPHQGSGTAQGNSVNTLVVFPHAAQGVPVQGARPSHSNIRCQSVWVGCPRPALSSPGTLEHRGTTEQYKLVGAPGRPPGPLGSSRSCDRSPHSSSCQQCGHESSCQVPGEHPVQIPDAGSGETPSLGGVTHTIDQGRAYLGNHEHAGGLAEQGHSRPC